jgi:hypothetical protein
VDLIGNRGKCIKQFVQIVIKNVKFLLNLEGADRFIAKNAIRKEKIAAVKKVLMKLNPLGINHSQRVFVC